MFWKKYIHIYLLEGVSLLLQKLTTEKKFLYHKFLHIILPRKDYWLHNGKLGFAFYPWSLPPFSVCNLKLPVSRFYVSTYTFTSFVIFSIQLPLASQTNHVRHLGFRCSLVSTSFSTFADSLRVIHMESILNGPDHLL